MENFINGMQNFVRPGVKCKAAATQRNKEKKEMRRKKENGESGGWN